MEGTERRAAGWSEAGPLLCPASFVPHLGLLRKQMRDERPKYLGLNTHARLQTLQISPLFSPFAPSSQHTVQFFFLAKVGGRWLRITAVLAAEEVTGSLGKADEVGQEVEILRQRLVAVVLRLLAVLGSCI